MKRKQYLRALAILLVCVSLFSNQQISFAADDDVFRVGMEAAYPPFNWTQKDDSNNAVPIEGSSDYANGYDVQMARKIAEGLGKKLLVVKTEWDGLVFSVNSGKIDAIMAGMSPTAERAKEIDFSKDYYKSDLTLVVNANGKYKDAKKLSDFSNAKVVAQLNTFHDTVVEQIPGVNHMEPMADFASMRVAVQSGKADAYVAEKPEGMTAQRAGVDLKMVVLEDGFKTSPEDTSIAIGLKKGNPNLAKMNQILEGISQEERDNLMEHILSIQEGGEKLGFLASMKDIFLRNKMGFLKGTAMTLLISLVGTLIGLAIGMLIGIIKTTPEGSSQIGNLLLKLIKSLLNIYVQVLRGTPMIVQSMLLYFGLLQFAGIDLMPLTAAFIVVSINTGAYMAEVVRGGIGSIDKGQFEAASALGMGHFQTMRYVVLPQAFRNIIPSVGNEFIVNIKDTSVLNVISVSELFFTTKSIAGANLKYFETYLITSAIYLILTLSVAFLLGLLEKKLRGSDSYEKINVLKSAN